MTGVDVPLLSKPSVASAALLVISTTIPAPEDRRAHLIREMVNLGWDDDNAVEFLALVAMPIDLLEETLLFLNDAKKKWRPMRRQRFFRFANEMFHDHLQAEAVVAVRNGMKLVDKEDQMFIPYLKERSDYLLERQGIDITQEMDDSQIVTAKALIALMDHVGDADGYGVIKDDALAELAVAAGEDYPVLIQHIVERGSLDAELLRDLMNAPAPAVSKGVL